MTENIIIIYKAVLRFLLQYSMPLQCKQKYLSSDYPHCFCPYIIHCLWDQLFPYLHHIIQVEFAPLLHIMGVGGTEQTSVKVGICTGSVNKTQLLSEASFACLKKFITFIHNKPVEVGHIDERWILFQHKDEPVGCRYQDVLKMDFVATCRHVFISNLHFSVNKNVKHCLILHFAKIFSLPPHFNP